MHTVLTSFKATWETQKSSVFRSSWNSILKNRIHNQKKTKEKSELKKLLTTVPTICHSSEPTSIGLLSWIRPEILVEFHSPLDAPL